MDEVAGGGVPDLQRQIVGRCDHRAVVAVPRYHGNFQLRHLVLQGRGVVLSTREREKKHFYKCERKMYGRGTTSAMYWR